jgi:hypothetical protein
MFSQLPDIINGRTKKKITQIANEISSGKQKQTMPNSRKKDVVEWELDFILMELYVVDFVCLNKSLVWRNNFWQASEIFETNKFSVYKKKPPGIMFNEMKFIS